MAATSKILVEGFVNKQIFPRTKVKSGDFAIFTFSPDNIKGEIDPRTKENKGGYKSNDIVFKGRVPELDGGTKYKILAELKQDPKYGWQYNILNINSVVKLDTEKDIRTFLGYVFTESQIDALYSKFPNPIEVLEENDVEKLCEVKGIRESKAKKILEKYHASKDNSNAYTALAEFGLSKVTIDRLVKHYGSADILVEKIQKNPYSLIGEGARIGWQKADSMALRKGIPTNSQFRIRAFALYYLRNLAEVDGHTWVALEALGSNIKGLSPSDISVEMVKNELRKMVVEGILYYEPETKRVGLMKYRKLEEMICRELIRLRDVEPKKMDFIEETIAECEEAVGFKYTDEQKSAIEKIVNENVILLTGLGGSGKSSLMYPVSRIFRRNGLRFDICALSGKASLNLRHITHENGMTIHRLLGWRPGMKSFIHHRENPLISDAIILDEVSMVGGELFYRLLEAIRDGSKLIMIGDPGQLESIGLCNLISDIRNSGKISSVHLSEIFRQAQMSGIITDSHKVYNQQPIIDPKFIGEEIHGELKDLYIGSYLSGGTCYQKVVDNFNKLYFDENHPLEDIVIVTAKRTIGELSSRALNEKIQETLGFEGDGLRVYYKDGVAYEINYHVGDRVLVTKNKYDAALMSDDLEEEKGEIEIFNGNIGTVRKVSVRDRYLIAEFPQGNVMINGDMLLNLQLGYAITCHKLQGSGVQYVIVACDPAAYMMLTKEWLYTALSRAKKYCVLIGTNKSITQCVKTTRVTKKSTWLAELLMFPERISCIRMTDTSQDETNFDEEDD